jgi:hypothetical protein
MKANVDDIREAIIESLMDTETGPLSDTPYIRAEVTTAGEALELFETDDEESWPTASIDVQQLANDIVSRLSDV